MDISAIEGTKTRLDEYVELRDIAINRSRRIVSLSRSLIQSIHNRKRETKTDETWKPLKQSKGILLEAFHEVLELIGEDPRLKHAGFWRNALQELTEAITFYSIINSFDEQTELTLPGPKEINVTDKSYVLGLGDLSGELKREILVELREENFERAETLLSLIDTLYQKLMQFDYPHSVLPGFKKKVDITREISLSTRETLVKMEKEVKLREALKDR